MSIPENSQGSVLSVIVVVVSDTINRKYDLSCLSICLEALQQQVDPPQFEILVPYPSQVTDFEILKNQFPQVTFIPIDQLDSYKVTGFGREHHDELRARGISAAHGEVIALIEDHGRPEAHWCRKIIEAHKHEFVGVGGAIENEVDRSINWAVYYCDFVKYQNPVPQGETSSASDANISYKKNALMSIQPVWYRSFHETEVNWAIQSRNEKISLSPDIIVYQHRNNLKVGDALKERYIWGQSYAITRSRALSFAKKIMYFVLTPLLPLILFTRTTLSVLKKGRNLTAYLKASPLLFLLLIGWSLGEASGYLKFHSA